MSNIIEINSLIKAFDNKTIINDISFCVPKNGLFGIIGLNGAGKTTTIKCMLNLIPEYSGDILINGKNAKHASSRKIVSYLPERFSPNVNITGYEYIKTYCEIYSTKFNKKQTDYFADELSLLPFLTQKIGKCSKGTVQKIGILACLLSETPIIVMDEPTSGLDVIARRKLKATLIKAGANKTILFTSHIMQDVADLANNIVVMAHSQVIFEGNPQGFKDKYLTQNFEEAFIASLS